MPSLSTSRSDAVQGPFLVRPQTCAAAQRVEAGAPERLVGVDVAHAGEELLVHQQWLQAALAATQHAAGSRPA